MKTNKLYKYGILLLVIVATVSCSTTKNLPEGEVLYTGIKKIEVTAKDETRAGDYAMVDLEAALEYPPNNSLFGSSSTRIPFPFGLWVYNSFVNKRGKLNKWIFNAFAAKPVLISTINPELRTKVASNLLQEHGYFNGTSSFEVIPDTKDPRKAAIEYRIAMNTPYKYDSIRYVRLRQYADTLLNDHFDERLLHKGDNFNVNKLEDERQRIATLLRNNGFYFYHSDYIVYQADTTMVPGKAVLRVTRKPGIPREALRPWKLGNISVHLNGYNNEPPTDSLQYRDLTIHYEGKLQVRPSLLYRQFKFKTGDLYSQTMEEKTYNNLARLGIFRYTDMQYSAQDTSRQCDTLNLRINSIYDYPLDGELEFNVTGKTNKLVGPGAIVGLTKRNVFRGGETFGVNFRASYEWQTGSRNKVKSSLIDSYEFGVSSFLTVPHAMLPSYPRWDIEFPSSTTFRVGANLLNLANFFRILSFSGSMTYDFQPTATSRHTLAPFRLSYNLLKDTTSLYTVIAEENISLKQSLKDQFIPAISYTYTYDNSPIRQRQNQFFFELSLTESGNLLSGVYALAGKNFNQKDKQFLKNPYAQFLKASAEVRYNYRIDRNQNLVGRLLLGGIYSYGNSVEAPYSEQFYAGGANGIRAFGIRTIGPGSFYKDPKTDKYAYINQIGDLKFEANLEFRFRLLGNLFGAAFLDAGNTWLMRKDTQRIGGELQLKNFLNEMALGTGFGVRYDFDFIVIRLDAGVKLHAPYDTGKKGYFNIPKYDMNALGIHLAVGYPF